jgi:hypothetical protein
VDEGAIAQLQALLGQLAAGHAPTLP